MGQVKRGRRKRDPVWGEQKKARTLSMTETGWNSIQKMARAEGFSRSEWLERLGRGRCFVPVVKGKSEETEKQTEEKPETEE